MQTSSSTSPVDSLKNSLPIGAVVGALAFVVNYVAVYAFMTADGVESGDTSMWKLAGQTLYNAQFVSLETSGGGDSVTYNVVTGDSSNRLVEALIGETDVSSTVPSAIYHLLPILVLVGAGLIVYKVATSDTDIAGAAAAGVTVAVGYLLLAIVGVFLFETSSNGATTAPEMMPAILLAGLAYPVVCGAIGGAIGDAL